VRDGDGRVEAERAVAFEERELTGRPCAFDGEHAELCRDAAARREATRHAACREHAMARHDDREGVPSESLPHRAGQALVAKARRHLAVRQGRARGNAAGDLVDTSVKRRHAFHVERHAVELDRGSCEKRRDGVERPLHVGRRRCLARVRETALHASARLRITRLRELRTGHAVLAPRNAAPADRRVEERESLCRRSCHHITLRDRLGNHRAVACRHSRTWAACSR
jgi:hypothetical protein